MTHLTAGLGNNNKVDLTSHSVSYTINGNVHILGTMNSTEWTFNKVAPYLGFGWSGQAKNSGFSFKSDFGVLFQGKPKATLTTTGASAPSGADLAKAQSDLDDSLKNFKYYPVISFGIGYAF